MYLLFGQNGDVVVHALPRFIFIPKTFRKESWLIRVLASQTTLMAGTVVFWTGRLPKPDEPLSSGRVALVDPYWKLFDRREQALM